MYDNDDSGYISKDELARVLGVCDPSLIYILQSLIQVTP